MCQAGLQKGSTAKLQLQELWVAEVIPCLCVQLGKADMDTIDAKWKLAALLPQYASVLVSVISEHRANRYGFLTSRHFVWGQFHGKRHSNNHGQQRGAISGLSRVTVA